MNIQKTLSALAIKEVNPGTSIGASSFSSGPTIKSYSPVNGDLIGSVTQTTKEEYEKDSKEEESDS